MVYFTEVKEIQHMLSMLFEMPISNLKIKNYFKFIKKTDKSVYWKTFKASVMGMTMPYIHTRRNLQVIY